MKEDDSKWPEPDKTGRQELEIVLGNEHISFATTKIGSLLDVQNSEDPNGLRNFYYLVQDLKCFVFSLISLHFKIKPNKDALRTKFKLKSVPTLLVLDAASGKVITARGVRILEKDPTGGKLATGSGLDHCKVS